MSRPQSLLAGLVESSLEAGAEARFPVEGRSMQPLIRPGDLVRLAPPDRAGARVGDVVAVRGMPDGGLLLHRVVRMRGENMLVRGDNTDVDNGQWAAQALAGVVTTVERDGRRVWFGAGRSGRLVAWAVRTGTVASLYRAARFLRLAGDGQGG